MGIYQSEVHLLPHAYIWLILVLFEVVIPKMTFKFGEKNIIRVKLGQVRFGYFMSFQWGEVWSSVVIFSLGYVCLCCAKIDYVIVNLDYDDTDFTPRQENTGF